ncbi:MAG: NmrA family NAD(P)-binding protein [Alphaproteobacteria bacterium]|nr:NmrA family NAD(P)-binding protein [Alphaproteobacteria bacterium]
MITHLARRGVTVRALVSNAQSAQSIEAFGATPMVGDMRDPEVRRRALAGISTFYHIAPGLMAEELDVGRQFIAQARGEGIKRFVLHGVSYPYAPNIDFHWTKMKLEVELLKSGLAFTIIRPTQFMQNITWSLPQILQLGEFALPYAPERRMGFVHIDDLGKAVANVLTEPGHAGATYELCSTARPIDRNHIAAALSRAFGVEIRAVRCSFDDLQGSHFFASLTAAQRQQLANMYEYIDRYGTAYFNNDVLQMLTGEPTTSYQAFADELAHTTIPSQT